ncbi:MAG: PEGA domain-containing protein [Patescibacteria group bacterium]
MDKRVRRLMFIGFFLVFVIIAPILVLHTSGYRFDWSQRRLFRTGLISLGTEPKGATVILNGVAQPKKTPVFLSNLLPGTYTIRATMDGYLPWQESVAVQSQHAAVLGTIDLILDQAPQVLAASNVAQVKISPDRTAAFVLSQSDSGLALERVALPAATVKNLGIYATGTTLLTEPFNDRVLISSPSGARQRIFLVDADSSKTALPLDFITTDLRQWQWVSSNELISWSNEGPCTVLLSEKTVACQTLSGQSFWYANKSLYYLNSDEQTTYLYWVKNRDISHAELITRLPRSERYRLVADNPKILVLIDGATQDLYTTDLNETETSLVRLPKAAKDAVWNDDHSQLLYYNDYEAYSWLPEENERKLLTRVSQPIASASWCGNYPHIVMSNDGRLTLLDSQTSPSSSITLAENATEWLAVDPDGHWVAYLTANQSRSTLWLRRLHE